GAAFECQVAGTGPFEITWHKDAKEIKPSAKHGFSQDPKIERTFENNVATLRIPACEATHGGKYTCHVVNEAGQDKCFATLTVQEQVIPPSFIKPLVDMQEILGSFVQICCKISGSLPISVEWQKDGAKISSGVKHKLIQQDNSVSVEIEQLERSDSGSYRCKLTNIFNTTVILNKEPPSFVLLPESQAALPNATVRFKATFMGTPPFTVKWFKDDTELMTGPTCFTGLDGMSCFLELYSVAVTQSGVYSSQVSNDAGSARCSVDLTVKEPPEFVLKLPAVKFVKQGESLRLECKVSGTAPLKMTWYKHDTKVTDGDNCRTSFADSVAVLELHSASFDDDGVYTCEAQNDAGSISCSTTLTVKEPPSFVKVPQPVEGLKGKDVSLYCEMSGTAPFQITWFKDKKPLMESRKYKMVSEGSSATLHVIGIEASDAGEYECKVSNSVGSDTCQTPVKLREPPSFVKKLSNMTVILGEEVTLVATVKGSEPITVSWVQDKDHILRDGDNRKITFENNKLALKVFKADATTAGRYTCQLRNDAGSVECFANLTVLGL
uniref:Ig-like domain-containing protein n=1 Tax=Acanthochromis polyacanthus TaxID=80966 RepID=A0A3Q1FXQ0_9TELE